MRTWFGQFVARRVCEKGIGKKSSCNKLFAPHASLFASVSEFALISADGDEDHPNQLPFEGLLVLLDEPSQKPPHGAQGHRIYVPSKVAKDNLSTLVGQGLNYASSLDEHSPRHKVGVITKAWIDDNKVRVKGWVWKKDFPEAERALKRAGLGMSMELANVYVRDEHEDVWHLEDFSFTGATVLRKDAAAYSKTSLTASAARRGDGGAMPKEATAKKKTESAASEHEETKQNQVSLLAAAVGESIKEAMKPTNDRLSALASDFGEVKELLTIQAAGKAEEEDDEEMSAAKSEEDDEEMSAKSEEDDEEEMAAAKSKHDESDEEDDNDEDDVDAALEDLEDKAPFREPGEVNKGMEKKGSKTTVTKVGAKGMLPNPVKSKGMSAASALMVREIVAARDKKWKRALRDVAAAGDKKYHALQTRYERMEAQLERFAEEEGRRSAIPVELANLAAKANVDLNEIRQSGSKLTGDQVSAMFAASGYELDPTQKIAMKMRLEEMDMLDTGRVERPWTQQQRRSQN